MLIRVVVEDSQHSPSVQMDAQETVHKERCD